MSALWDQLSVVIVGLAMAKIVLSLVAFTIHLIVKSPTSEETWAKAITTSLSVVVIVWVTNAIIPAFDASASQLLRASADSDPMAKLKAGAVAGGCTYVGFWILEGLATASLGYRYVQTLLVFIASASVTLIIPSLA